MRIILKLPLLFFLANTSEVKHLQISNIFLLTNHIKKQHKSVKKLK
jgi:hypothetical protein